MWIVKVINLQESLHHALSTPRPPSGRRCPSENESSQLLSEYTTHVNREWAAKLVHLQDKHIPSDWLNDIEIKTLQCGQCWIHQIDTMFHSPSLRVFHLDMLWWKLQKWGCRCMTLSKTVSHLSCHVVALEAAQTYLMDTQGNWWYLCGR